MTDDTGNPLLSNWMPIATASAGMGYGVQVIYQGGATIQNPTDGEQCLVGVFDKARGVAAMVGVFYHANNPPPATNLPTVADGYGSAATPAVPGDVIISAAPAVAGGANTFVRLRQSGVVDIWAAGAVNADVQGPINITAEGTNPITVTAVSGNITVSALSGVVNVMGAAIRLSRMATDALLQLCNSAFWTNFNVHHHGTGGPPIPQADETMLTQTLTAE